MKKKRVGWERRWCWLAAFALVGGVMLLPAVGCRADGEEAGATAAPAAPAPSVEDQYQKLLGSVAAPAASGADTYAAALGALVATDPAALYGADGKLPDEPTLLRILNNLLFLDQDNGDHQIIPSVYKTMCAAIYQAHGQDWGFYQAQPPHARLILAIYLATQGQGEAMKSLMTSLTAEERHAADPYPGYQGAHTLDMEHSHNMLPWIIWLYKYESTWQGPGHQAMISDNIMAECEEWQDQALMTSEVIPWAEAALARDGVGTARDEGLSALIMAYEYTGQAAQAVARGEYWLKAAQADPSLNLEGARYCVVHAMEQTDYHQAEQALRAMIAQGGSYAELAQADLILLAQAHPDLTGVEILPGRFQWMSPNTVSSITLVGQATSETLEVRGNATFRVQGGTCDLAGAKVTLGERKLERYGSIQELTIALGAFDQAGVREGKVVLATNDPAQPQITVPFRVDIRTTMFLADPASFSFGVVRPGEASAPLTLTLRGVVNFTVTGVKVDAPEIISVEVTGLGPGGSILKATLHAPAQAGPVQGTLEVSTDYAPEPKLNIPYSATVSAEDGAAPGGAAQ